jgi:hypothetical protein
MKADVQRQHFAFARRTDAPAVNVTGHSDAFGLCKRRFATKKGDMGALLSSSPVPPCCRVP